MGTYSMYAPTPITDPQGVVPVPSRRVPRPLATTSRVLRLTKLASLFFFFNPLSSTVGWSLALSTSLLRK